MISALLLATASLSASAAWQPAAYASDTVRHLKGHMSLPVAAGTKARGTVKAACHPDPNKGRACRHHQAQAEQNRSEAFAALEADGTRERAQ